MTTDTKVFFPRFAETAVIRTKEWRFEVDGSGFPWYVSARGPIVTRYYDDIWSIDVEIFAIDRETKKTLITEADPRLCIGADALPIIGGVKFPWLMTKDGWTLSGSSRQLMTLHTTFLARDVDTDGEVIDQREEWAGRAFYANGGDCYKQGTECCYYCKEWVNDLFDHHQEMHPEHITVTKEGHRQIDMTDDDN